MPLTVEDLKGKTSDELIAQVVSLSEENEGLKTPEAPAPVAAPETPAPAETPAETPAPAEAPADGGEGKQMSEKLGNVEKRLSEVEADNAKLRREKHESDVGLTLSQYAQKGVPNSTLESARQMMLADSGKKEYKLTEKDSEGKDVIKDVTLSDMAIAMLDNTPTVQLGEATLGTPIGGDPNTAPKSATSEQIQKVWKFAEEKNLTFKQAYTQLSDKGEIKRS